MTLVLYPGVARRALDRAKPSGPVRDELPALPLTPSKTAAVTHAVPAV